MFLLMFRWWVCIHIFQMASFDYVLYEACLHSCGISNLPPPHSIRKIICTVYFSESSTSVNTTQLACLISHQGAIISFSDHISNTGRATNTDYNSSNWHQVVKHPVHLITLCVAHVTVVKHTCQVRNQDS